MSVLRALKPLNLDNVNEFEATYLFKMRVYVCACVPMKLLWDLVSILRVENCRPLTMQILADL